MLTKKPHKYILAITLLLGLVGTAYSQKKELIKADNQFKNLSYIDAREIYLQVVNDGYESAEIYQKLADTYYWNSEYASAAKWYGKLIEKHPNEIDIKIFFRAAQSYKSINNYEESDRLMNIYVNESKDEIIANDYEKNKDYLSIIAFESKNYELKKVAVSTKTSDFGSAYFGDKIVFASADGTTGDRLYVWTDQPYLDLFMADQDAEGELSNKRKIEGDINTDYHESSAVFTKDGNTIYFTRNNLKNGKRAKKDKEKTVRLKLYKATKMSDGTFRDVKELPFNSKDYSVAHPAISIDEKRLYFSSDMPGTFGMSDLFYVDILENDTYGPPVNLGPSINTEARESFPFISTSNNLYFATDGRVGLGGFDIYSAPIEGNTHFGEVKNIGVPANSNQDDFGIIINEDNSLGYLSSNRGGESGSAGDDIYRVQYSSCKIEIAGTVIDETTGNPISRATVVLIDRDNEEIGQVEADEKGRFSFPQQECNRQYIIRASKENYEPNEEVIQAPNETTTLNNTIQLKPVDPCPPNDLGCRLTLQPIYFDFDKSFIRPDAAIELSKILAAMRTYPELVIHIESHTDSRGSDTYNESLSERRAQSTLQWLIANGIDGNRLTAKGYGEYRLINGCSQGNDSDCTEEEHQLNRRSMFIIQN